MFSSGAHPLFIASGYWGGFGKARRRPGFFAATDWGVMEVRGVDDDDQKVFIGGAASCPACTYTVFYVDVFCGIGLCGQITGIRRTAEPNVDSET